MLSSRQAGLSPLPSVTFCLSLFLILLLSSGEHLSGRGMLDAHRWDKTGGNRSKPRFVAWWPRMASQNDGFMVASAMTSTGSQASLDNHHIHECPATSCPKHARKAAELKKQCGYAGAAEPIGPPSWLPAPR